MNSLADPNNRPVAQFEQQCLSTPRQILHDGQFVHGRHAQIARRVTLSQAAALVPSGKSDALIRTSFPTEGRCATSSTRDGMRWTRQRAQTKRAKADGEIVWSWRPDAGVKLAGDDLQATVAKKPGHRGEHV